MGYFRRVRLAADYEYGNAAVNRVRQSIHLSAAGGGDEAHPHMDLALLRLLTQLASCGIDACSPPVLRIQQRA